MKQRIPIITFAIIGILALGLQSLLVNPKQEAWALQAVTVNTTLNPTQVKYALYNSNPAFVTLQGLSRVTVYDAKTTTVLSNFNMTNILRNGFGITYAVRNMDCDIYSVVPICIVAYTTQGTGSCSGSPNACPDRVVLFNYQTNQWSSLKNGFNYTDGNFILGNVVFAPISSQGNPPQFTVWATYQPNGGGNSLIDNLYYNLTDAPDSHPFIMSTTTNTGSGAGFTNVGTAGVFTIGGACCNIFDAEASPSINTFIDFDRGRNAAGCSLNLGQPLNDIAYANDAVGTFWYVVSSTSIFKISQTGLNTCTTVASINLSTLSGGNNLNSVTVDSSRGEVYTQSNTKVFVINESSFASTPLLQFSSPTASASGHTGLASYPATQNGALAVTSSTTKLLVEFWNAQGSGSSPNPPPTNTCGAVNVANCQGQINCENPAYVNYATCTGTPAGIAVGNGGGNAFNNGINLVNATGAVISQGLGLSNNNIKTNGVGYLYLVLALILVNIMWLLAVHSFTSGGIIHAQPIFVSGLLSFAVIFGFVLMGITDSLFLIIGVVMLIAFSAPKIVGMIRGGGNEVTAS